MLDITELRKVPDLTYSIDGRPIPLRASKPVRWHREIGSLVERADGIWPELRTRLRQLEITVADLNDTSISESRRDILEKGRVMEGSLSAVRAKQKELRDLLDADVDREVKSFLAALTTIEGNSTG